MPSYEDRKRIIQETLLKRLGRMFRADERTPAVIEEACRAVVQRLPSGYDTAACEAVCEEAGTRVVAGHRYATWPSVAEIAGAVADVVSERMQRERVEKRDRRIDEEAAQTVSKLDQWTLEGARERIRRCDAELARADLTDFDRWILHKQRDNAETAARRKEAG